MSEIHDVTGRAAVTNREVTRGPTRSWKMIAVITWLGFSIALALWWMIFGLQQVARLTELATRSGQPIAPEIAEVMSGQHRMLVYEGTTLIVLLLVGGGALIYYINTEMRRAQKIQEFFAAFTHDLKTSLASLRLQAESLEEDLKDSGEARVARRLVKDTVRLELQLENSLLLAAPETETRLLMEPIRLSQSSGVLQALRSQWPDLELSIEGEATVSADRRAVESIFKNLLQNAVVHGRSARAKVDIGRGEGRWIQIRIVDDGRGFKGDVTKLGSMFHRHASTSGSGLGLYLAMNLAKRMGGELRIMDESVSSAAGQGFGIEILLLAASPEAEGDSDQERES